ncbi:MAG: ribosome recycling factor [Candidatus Improbicoccus devescovinae]|nr:MAG: ribosome recycling factor [Candidatus Improbicoccus devescovinae]
MKIVEDFSASAQKIVVFLENEYKTVRSNRANPAIIDKIKIDYYGSPTPITQIASVSVTEARVLCIQPWDISVLNTIEKAILKSDLGISPQNNGKVIKIIFPPLSEELRKEIVKNIQKIAEDSKISVRNTRRDFLDKIKNLKKQGELPTDEVQRLEKQIQNIVDTYISQIDDIKQKKIQQVMGG